MAACSTGTPSLTADSLVPCRMVSEQTSAEAVETIRVAMMDLLNRNDYVLQKNSEGLTHEHSLEKLDEGGSNLNWLLGHMTASRDVCTRLLGAEATWDKDHARKYGRGSEVPETGKAEPLEKLLAAVADSGERLRAALSEATMDQLTRPNPRNAGERVIDAIYFLVWHDTYHAGQTALYRRLAGLAGVF